MPATQLASPPSLPRAPADAVCLDAEIPDAPAPPTRAVEASPAERVSAGEAFRPRCREFTRPGKSRRTRRASAMESHVPPAVPLAN
jgi:hypothetical protein